MRICVMLTSSSRLRKAEWECNRSKMYFNFPLELGGNVISTYVKQYCPWIPNCWSLAFTHWSKSPNWLTFPFKMPDGILADASYTVIKNNELFQYLFTRNAVGQSKIIKLEANQWDLSSLLRLWHTQVFFIYFVNYCILVCKFIIYNYSG